LIDNNAIEIRKSERHYLCDGVEVVESEVPRLSVQEAVFIGSTRHDISDVETVSDANDANE